MWEGSGVAGGLVLKECGLNTNPCKEPGRLGWVVSGTVLGEKRTEFSA